MDKVEKTERDERQLSLGSTSLRYKYLFSFIIIIIILDVMYLDVSIDA